MQQALVDLRSGMVLTVVFCVLLFVVAPAFIDVPPSIEIRALAPDYWPLVLLRILVGFSLLLILLSYLKIRNTRAEQKQTSTPSSTVLPHANVYRCVLIVIFTAYYVLIPVLGLLAASALALPAMALLYGERRFVLLAASTVCVLTFLQIFFVSIANVPVPTGIFGF